MESTIGNPPIEDFISILDSGDGVIIQFRIGGFYQLPMTYDRFDEFLKLANKRHKEIIPLVVRQAMNLI